MSVKKLNDYKFYNPHDTINVLTSTISKKAKFEFNRKKNREEKKDWWFECEKDFDKNMNLLFSKLIPYTTNPEEESENKDKYLNMVINEFERIKKKYIPDVWKRIKQTIEDFQKNGFFTQNFSYALSWRLVIGLGASHPQETSMTLHHIYGIPYIPGSAIKGVTRHWAVLRFAEELAKKNNLGIEKAIEEVSKKLENGDESLSLFLDTISFQDLIKIFGTQKEEGKVIFFDAYPDENIELKIDIMNPHYPDYYGGDKTPTDWQNPVPIKFLTIEKTKFQFYLASRDKDLLTKAENLLKDALKNYGIGAKTSLGYGVFEEV
ncbi:type III-B CRISPR module RAMP protein Cmr6 [Caldisericum exile]|uniref:type III-B CRISPR module RAMP protein Cmr6 n=1 Tax=Caldisericum exile TaxID=693075 RepID=UPI003C720BE8